MPVFPIAPKTGANTPYPGGTPLPSNGQVASRVDTDKYNVQKPRYNEENKLTKTGWYPWDKPCMTACKMRMNVVVDHISCCSLRIFGSSSVARVSHVLQLHARSP